MTENLQLKRNFRKRPRLVTGSWRRFAILCLILAATAIVSPAQDEQPAKDLVKFTSLVNFDGANGASVNAYGMLPIQGTDGNLYGTTLLGDNFNGTVFKVTPTGTLANLYNFCSQPNCADGANPSAGLVLGIDGNFYGTTTSFGANGYGTIFRMTLSSSLTTLYNFCSQPNCTDGDINYGGLIQGADGNFYGTTPAGGVNQNSSCGDGVATNCGNIFKITPDGAFMTIYSFRSQANCADGISPYTALVQGTDGNLYGLTSGGGANGL